MRFTVALTIAVAALFSTATARAAVVYERGLSRVSVWIANDDGSGARKLVSGGQEPHLAPDGSAVVYIAHADRNDTERRDTRGTAGHWKLLLKPIRYGAFAWSPDSRYIAA